MEWISIEDRLPEKDGFYLVYAKSDNPFIPEVYVQEYVQEIGFTYDGEWVDTRATHWMPLPKPPKEGEQ